MNDGQPSAGIQQKRKGHLVVALSLGVFDCRPRAPLSEAGVTGEWVGPPSGVGKEGRASACFDDCLRESSGR